MRGLLQASRGSTFRLLDVGHREPTCDIAFDTYWAVVEMISVLFQIQFEMDCCMSQFAADFTLIVIKEMIA